MHTILYASYDAHVWRLPVVGAAWRCLNQLKHMQEGMICFCSLHDRKICRFFQLLNQVVIGFSSYWTLCQVWICKAYNVFWSPKIIFDVLE